LTVNGKVDRNALLAIEEKQEESTVIEEPQTKVEIELSIIWAKLLKRPFVSIRDNFFELGGDSILGLQMIMLASQRDIKISPKQLFEYQTIYELAKVAITISKNEEPELVTTNVKLPLTPIQSWYFNQNYPNLDHYNQSVLLTLEQ